MYLLYETYIDEVRNMKKQQLNTRIIGLYQDKKSAKEYLINYINDIILAEEKNEEWYVIPHRDKRVLKEQNKNLVEVYQVFNDFIGNFTEMFYIVLEKINIENERRDRK